MAGNAKYVESNRRLWDAWADLHEASDFYDLEGFVEQKPRRAYEAAPGVRVHDFEPGEVGDVTGKDLLHLQCHVGVDTLSWARLGASVTGVDFSERAIAVAQALSKRCGIDARFVCSSVEGVPEALDQTFDVVYTSRGAVWWLADLSVWGEVIARSLRPGGVFYITEFHPFAVALDDDCADELRVRYPYFPTPEPQEFSVHGSYADPDAEVAVRTEYGWQHSLAEIVTTIAEAGLRIEFLHEFGWVSEGFGGAYLRRDEDGRRRPKRGEVPLMYSLRARKG